VTSQKKIEVKIEKKKRIKKKSEKLSFLVENFEKDK